MLPQKQMFDDYVKLGLVRSRRDASRLLTIYVYTEVAQFDHLWDQGRASTKS